ncbi:MAG: L,D-transpeptidase family protein [Acidobacteriota bacterium]
MNSIYMKAIIKFNAFLTGSVLIFAIGASGAFAAAGDATKSEQSAAAVSEAERLLADMGYWIAKVDGVRDDSTRQAILAFQKVEGLKRTGILNPQVLESIRTASRPDAKFAGEAHVEIDITRQIILLVDDAGTVTNILSTSTGSGERYFSEGKWQKAYTPLGTFKITRQIKGVRKAPLGSIYYPSYFHEGWAIHGSNSVPATPASHGCARIPRFADKQFVSMVRVGMTVHVYK